MAVEEEDRMARFGLIPTSFAHELRACLHCWLVTIFDQALSAVRTHRSAVEEVAASWLRVLVASKLTLPALPIPSSPFFSYLMFLVLDIIADALKHYSASVRIGACMCIKSISRYVKVQKMKRSFSVVDVKLDYITTLLMNLDSKSKCMQFLQRNGSCPLIQLLTDAASSVQVLPWHRLL